MNFFSWNCRGLGHPDSLNYLKRIIRNLKPDCIFLMETKCYFRRMEKICKALNYTNFFIVEARGAMGDLVLMWTKEMVIECF